MARQRIIYLDVIRVIACCMIVLMHSPHPDAGVPGAVQVPLSFLTAPGIGLFFMVSGALLLPVKMETGIFLKKRMGKIIGPLLFWTLFYIGVKLFAGEISVQEVPQMLLSIPFSAQGHGVLWFMYTLVGLYLLAPVISAFLEKSSKRLLNFYLLLWLITLCYPLVSLFLSVNRTETGMLYYFTGYAGYFVLGYYLHKYSLHIKPFVLAAMILIPLILLLLHKYFRCEGDFYDLFWYLSIMVATMCVAWFVSVQQVAYLPKVVGGKFLIVISNACFGIYLMHIFVMRRVLWNIDFLTYGLGWVGQLMTSWLMTLVICSVLTWLISYLPFSEYIIGFTNRKKK